MQILYLDDRKVLKRFGKRPDLGRVIGGASPSVKVNISSPNWVVDRMFSSKTKRQGVHNGQRGGHAIVKGHWENTTPVTVRYIVALKCVGKGKWQALCQESHRTYVEWWLVTHCGQGKPDYSY
jgi:hypothetical protein